MDEQPKYNRILGYTPESNRAVFELAPDQFGSVAVINCANFSGKDPATPEYGKLSGGQWHSGRSIRINPLGDRGQPVAASDAGKVYHRNCMWFDVEIDKEYLDQNAVTHVDTILRGNISDNMVYATIWWPVSEGPPDFTGPYTIISPQEPENPLPPCQEDQPDVECGPTVWIQTIESDDSDLDIPIAIKTYTKLVEETLGPGGIVISRTWDWEVVYGNENGQGIYNTTTINNIPTYVFNSEKQCRFVVQVHWNQNFAHTAIDREVALYVFKGDTDATRSYQDYIVKSPIVKMRNKPNPGPPAPGEPSQKGFKPASMSDFYTDPARKYLQLPITNTEIVMDVMSGTAMIDPNDEYENAVFVDLVGDDAELKLHCGPGSEAWVMAPVDDGTYIGNFPYYIGERTQDPADPFGPLTEDYILTLSGPGRYAIYGQGALLPRTEEIISWLELNNFPTADYEPRGVITQQSTAGMFENTKSLSNITSWQDILLTTGKRMFANVTGDFYLPEYQIISDLTQTFINTPDFTGTQGGINTWITDSATQAYQTFKDSTNFDANIDDWNTGQVTTMYEMFANCVNYNQPLNSWDVSKVTTMFGMFRNCSVFDQPLGDWNTQNVAEPGMNSMFENCSVFDQNISNWNVKKIPNKPTNFDLNTTDTWTIWEKPWWGLAQAPQGDMIVIDAKIGMRIRAQSANLQIFRANKELYKNFVVTETTSESNKTEFLYPNEINIIFGTATEVSFPARDLSDMRFMRDHFTNTDYVVNNPHPFQESINNDEYQTPEELDAYANSIISQGETPQIDNCWGENNDLLENWNKVFLTMGSGAFKGIGKLPDVMPTEVVFADNVADVFAYTFAGCHNIPDQSVTDTWVLPATQVDFDCTGMFTWSVPTNGDKFLNRIIAQAETINLSKAFSHCDISGLDFSGADDTTKVTDFSECYANTNIDSPVCGLAHLDTSECKNTSKMFLHAQGQNSFCSTMNMKTSNVTDMSFMFAYSEVVPNDMQSLNGTWDISNVRNAMCMFMFSKFPNNLNSWNISRMGQYANTWTSPYGDNLYHMDSGCWGMFLGAQGSPTTMENWVLYDTQNSEYIANTNNWHVLDSMGVTGYGPEIGLSGRTWTPGGLVMKRKYVPYNQEPGSDYSYSNINKFVHNLLPAAFALTPDFNCDLSTWICGYNTNHSQTNYIRDYTFAWAQSFDSDISWYYPPDHNFGLEYMQPGTRDLVQGDDWKATQPDQAYGTWTPCDYSINPWRKDFFTMENSALSPQRKWWNTFTGSSYNNGGQPIPTIVAISMLSTFRDTPIDAELTINKPLHGQGYYSRVFEGTNSWTTDRRIIWRMQNRKDNPDLVNVYYHTIYSDKMFKNSNYNSSSLSNYDWKWFWFNVSNIFGYTPRRAGFDDQVLGWNNVSDRQDILDGNGVEDYTVNDGYFNRTVFTNGCMLNSTGIPNHIRGHYNSVMFIKNNTTGFWRNDWVGGSNLPPVSRQSYKCGGIRCDTTLPYFRNPLNPVESYNLQEMFAGNTAMDQDLSDVITRWAPIRGAYTNEIDDDWNDNNLYEETWLRPYNNSAQQTPESYLKNANTYNNQGRQYYSNDWQYARPFNSDTMTHRSDEKVVMTQGAQPYLQPKYLWAQLHPLNFGEGADNFDKAKWPLWLADPNNTSEWFDTNFMIDWLENLQDRGPLNNQYLKQGCITPDPRDNLPGDWGLDDNWMRD